MNITRVIELVAELYADLLEQAEDEEITVGRPWAEALVQAVFDFHHDGGSTK